MSKLFYLVTIFLILQSCLKQDLVPFDRETKATKDQIKYTLIRNREQEKKKAKQAKYEHEIVETPKISKMIITPPPPKIGSNKIVSFSVTDQIPLKDVLIEIGRVAEIDVDVDPSIEGGIIINAVNRPLKEVLDRIASLGKLRYSYENGVLHFERDTPFLRNYFVDYLVDGSLWGDVESNITSILNSNSGQSSSSTQSSVQASSYTSNKSAGIISVFANLSQHDLVEKYLSAVEKTASAQVLIEAKVVEVSLTDEFSTGINWSWLSGKSTLTTTTDAEGATTSAIVRRREAKLTGGYDDLTAPFTFAFNGLLKGNIDAQVSALEKFGTTKTLSSPRIHAMNNQSASLNFADKLVYFKLSRAQTTSTTQSDNVVETLSSEMQEENVGVELQITPSINLRTREVVMKIKPTLSVKSGEVVDPASPTDDNGLAIFENKVPIIQSREIETIAKVESGNVLVIGGLMKEGQSDSNTGIPYLQDIPIIGWLFKSNQKSSNVTETVIFIKATIVSSGDEANSVDKDLQDMFDNSRRKFFE